MSWISNILHNQKLYIYSLKLFYFLDYIICSLHFHFSPSKSLFTLDPSMWPSYIYLKWQMFQSTAAFSCWSSFIPPSWSASLSTSWGTMKRVREMICGSDLIFSFDLVSFSMQKMVSLLKTKSLNVLWQGKL